VLADLLGKINGSSVIRIFSETRGHKRGPAKEVAEKNCNPQTYSLHFHFDFPAASDVGIAGGRTISSN
jgi:hypothetical protein